MPSSKPRTRARPARGSPPVTLGFLLADLLRLLRRDFAMRATGLGLTPALWRVLAHLMRCEGCHQKTLAERLDITAVTLGRMIDRLERNGIVRRAADPADRRASRLYLTPAAQPLLKLMLATGALTAERAMTGLGAGERRTLLTALASMRDNLADARTDPKPRAGGRQNRGN